MGEKFKQEESKGTGLLGSAANKLYKNHVKIKDRGGAGTVGKKRVNGLFEITTGARPSFSQRKIIAEKGGHQKKEGTEEVKMLGQTKKKKRKNHPRIQK